MTSHYLRHRLTAGFTLALLSPLAAAITPEQIFVQVSPSVVVVDIFDAKGKSIGQGSGAVIAAGQVVTNCHVAQNGKSLRVRQSGKTFKATLQYADPDRDLCQLSAPDLQAPPIVLGTAKKLRVGQRVYAIGAPQGLELTLSEGLISSLRHYQGSQYIQTSAAISPGSSGGGLFDDQGRLIGITTFQLTEGQNLNFALPVDWIGELPKRSQLASTADKKRGLNWLNDVHALIEKRDLRGLLKISRLWVRSEPRSADAWRYLGSAYRGLEQYDKAIQAYRKALRIDPWDAAAWDGLGNAYRNLKQYDDAIEAHRLALRVDPEYAGAWVSLGDTYGDLRQYDKAIHAYEEALRIEPEYVAAWDSLGHVYSDLKQYEKAIQAHREAVRIRPDDFDRWLSLGFAYSRLKQFEDALQAFREALRIEPNAAAAWDALGFAYADLKQYDKAIQAYREAVRIRPEYAEAWNSLGFMYYLLGHRDEVRVIYQTLRKLDPAMAEKYFNDLILGEIPTR